VLCAARERPQEPDTTALATADLTADDRGGVQVVGGEAGIVAGQLVAVQVGEDRAGEWVSVWVNGTRWLGWVQVSPGGTAQVRIPADLGSGRHVLVVEDRQDALIDWDSFSSRGEDIGPANGSSSGNQDLDGVQPVTDPGTTTRARDQGADGPTTSKLAAGSTTPLSLLLLSVLSTLAGATILATRRVQGARSRGTATTADGRARQGHDPSRGPSARPTTPCRQGS